MCSSSIFIPGAAGQHDWKFWYYSDSKAALNTYHFTAYTKHLMDVWLEEIAGKPRPTTDKYTVG